MIKKLKFTKILIPMIFCYILLLVVFNPNISIKLSVQMNGTETVLSNNEPLAILPKITEKKVVTVQSDKNDVTKLSNISEQELSDRLEGTKLAGLAPSILLAEQKYHINAIFLTSLIINNSNWGNSIRTTNNNNLTNINVTDNKSMGSHFYSKEDCIDYTAVLLAAEYLDKDGLYYEGKSIENISTHYCNGSSSWTDNVTSITQELLN